MRRTDDGLIAALIGIVLFGGWIVFCLLLAAIKLWVIGSLLTSGIKAAKGDCGQLYGVESVLSGDWFCPTPSDKQSDNADTPTAIAGSY